jgi:hypothetical protein
MRWSGFQLRNRLKIISKPAAASSPENFCLENFPFSVKRSGSLKVAEFSAYHCSQMPGNPVKIRDGCATVTATNSKATDENREGGMRFEAQVRIPV